MIRHFILLMDKGGEKSWPFAFQKVDKCHLTYKYVRYNSTTDFMRLSGVRKCWSYYFLVWFWRIVIDQLPWILLLCCRSLLEVTQRCVHTFWRPFGDLWKYLHLYYFVFRLYASAFVTFHHIPFFFYCIAGSVPVCLKSPI